MNKFLKLVIISIISILGLYYAFKGEDLANLIMHIKNVDFKNFLFAIFVLLISCLVRAYRWNLIMRPFTSISYGNVLSATMIGYFGNGVLAFRLGELLKAYSVANKNSITTAQAFGTVVLERLLDIITLLAIIVLLIPWFPFEYDMIKYSVLVFSALTIIAIIILYIFSKYNLIKKYNKFVSNDSKSKKKIFSSISNIFDGFTSLKANKEISMIIFSSIILWIIYLFETMIIVRACNLDFNIIDSGIILVIGSIALGIPALPGSAGTYDAGLKYSLEWIFQVPGDIALNYAIISHFIAYFPCLLIGLIYFLISNIKINDIKSIEIEN